jgi:hypothetical protein
MESAPGYTTKRAIAVIAVSAFRLGERPVFGKYTCNRRVKSTPIAGLKDILMAVSIYGCKNVWLLEGFKNVCLLKDC